MAWLRIDDGFTSNSKVAQLDDAQFRVWIRLLCHCAKAQDPTVDSVTIRETSGLDRRRVSTYYRLGLLDKLGNDFEVHSWAKYLPKEAQKAERQARWRARQRNGQVDASVDAEVDETVDASASRTRAGTRGVPSRPVPKDSSDEDLSFTPSALQDADGRTDDRKQEPEPVAGEAAELLARLQAAQEGATA